jgi:NAD(P)-dependent dehydrogenase (short-subunit alcohol dehydrogenase family)
MVTNAGGVATGYCADLSDAEDLDRLIADLGAQDSVDVLVNNAGALSAHYARSRQGIEHTVAVHVVAPYRLQRDLVMSPRGKVIMMTSGGMYTERFNLDRLEMPEATYRGVTAYARAKRAQVVLTSALQRQREDDRDFYAVHPGWARTPGLDDSLPGFARTLRPLLRTSAEGVDTTAWLCVQPEGQPSGGGLWLDRRERPIYRLRRTHKNEEDERRDEAALLAWLEARITER